MRKLIKDNSGLTLVEVLVVVVILVVLASMILPSFTKYFVTNYDEKKEKEAQSILDSSQMLLYDLYAIDAHSDENNCIIWGTPDNKTPASSHPTTYRITNTNTGDCDIHWNQLAFDILKNAGMDIHNNEPCIVMICTGNYEIYADPNKTTYDPEKAYTVYMVIYQPIFKDTVYYLTKDGNVVNSSPVTKEKVNGVDKNFIKLDNEKIYIQYYSIKNGKDNKDFMNSLWSVLKKF